MDPHSTDLTPGFWETVFGGIISLFALIGGALMRGYDKRLDEQAHDHAAAVAEVKADAAKLWERVASAERQDRERWERFESRLDKKFDDLRTLIIARNPHGGD